ncbi:MAG: SufD family Fe-S cluster assembly protein [Patescibacteria group bacterium]
MTSRTFVNDNYRYGFSMPERYVFKTRKGIGQDVVEQISLQKKEPVWMREYRLKSFAYFQNRPLPTWGASLEGIDFNALYYYIKPVDAKARTWEDLPEEIKKTYDAIGIPESEKKQLAGVTAQYESEVVYGSLLQSLTAQGVIFCDMDTGLRDYPDIVKQYFGTIIPANDNKFAALNSAVWSGGSFIYVPPGVKVELPLQAYFRINAANMGQFERTLIIADEGSFVHYVEGCFAAGTKISTDHERRNIEDIKAGDQVLTHTGTYQEVCRVQRRNYTGQLYEIDVWGDSNQRIHITENHPVLVVDRVRSNERNKFWTLKWKAIKDVRKGDYLTIPIPQGTMKRTSITFPIKMKGARKGTIKTLNKTVALTPEFVRLIGYYLAEGSVDRGFYTSFSFSIYETNLVHDVEYCLKEVFGIRKTYKPVHKTNHGISVVVSSAEVSRIFAYFGKGAQNKKLPSWAIILPHRLQQQLITAYFRGDGNYYNRKNKHGQKEICRFSTISETLAYQVRDILLRLGIVATINARKRAHEQGRHTMYTVGIGGAYLKQFGEIVGLPLSCFMYGKNRASLFGNNELYAFVPVKNIKRRIVRKFPVFNFSVKNFESYAASGIVVHNCTAPIYTADSLHAAVVEIIVKPHARVRYTTIQNWSNNVYNLVTKRMRVEENAVGEWLDCNLGSKVTMKYPSCFLVGPHAHGEILSLAVAGEAQHQDAGGKMIHCAPDTTSTIISKSVSQSGGRTSYRGLVRIKKGALRARSKVVCDALIVDERSRSDTYPNMVIDEREVTVEHEASVSKIGEEQLFYLQSRGLDKTAAEAMIVNGFIEPVVKELPMEYAVEMNRLIAQQMDGSVG